MSGDRLIGRWAFLGVCIASYGGPLALAALNAPALVDETANSAGLVVLLGTTAFLFPLSVWIAYSRQIAGPAGLTGFVAAAAGRPAAILQGVLWLVSYALYVVYTPASIVYETLPAIWPSVTSHETALVLILPLVLAGILVAGRGPTLAVIGVLAIGQLMLAVALIVVITGHGTPVSSFAASGRPASLAIPAAQTSLLFVCGSLPLYLGGEVRSPQRVVPRGLLLGFAVTAICVVLAVFPLAANPAFTHAAIPGVSFAQILASPRVADAIGLGVALSITALLLVEAIAVSRLLSAVTTWSADRWVRVLAVVLVVSGPVSVMGPQRIVTSLLQPSLLALWASQLLVFVVYPLFVRRRRRLRAVDLVLAAGASAIAVYGVYFALTTATS